MKKLLILMTLLILASCGSNKNPDVVYVDSAHTTVTTIDNLQWEKNKFPLRIVVPANFQSSYATALQGAANTWNNALGFTAFNIVYDGLNLVYSRAEDYGNDSLCVGGSCGKLYSFVLHPNWFPSMTNGNSILAITAFSYDRTTAKMVHADILFNDKNYDFEIPTGPSSNTWSQSISMDLESVLVHEMGHFLGLKHVCQSESQRKNNGVCNKSETITDYDACKTAGGEWTSACIGSIGDSSTLDVNSIMNMSLASHSKKRSISPKDLYYINKIYKNECTVNNSLIARATEVEGISPNCEVTACVSGYTPSADKLSCE